MSDPLRPLFFVTRQNGTMIPLIAMDELPATISIKGVPRMLSPYDVTGMTGIGTFNSRHRMHVVDAPRKIEPDFFRGSSYAANESDGNAINEPFFRGTADESIFSSPPSAFGEQTPIPSLAQPTVSPPIFPHPEITEQPLKAREIDQLPINSAPGVKEYCSYWLRHGECDYAQQGCLYRHEMPLDKSTLEKLGLRDIPRWYREKHRLGSYLAGGTTMGGINPGRPALLERSWRRHPAELTSGATPRVDAKEVPAYRPVVPSSQALGVHRGSNSTAPFGQPFHLRAGHASNLNKHQPSPNFAQAKRSAYAAPSVSVETESVSARQVRETIKALDAYDEREQNLVAEKYKALMPQKQEAGATMAEAVAAVETKTETTPSTSTASLVSFETEPTIKSDVPKLPATQQQPSLTSPNPAPVVAPTASKRKTNRKHSNRRYPKKTGAAVGGKA